MDGVLTDFIKSYFNLTGIDITGKHLNGKKFWNPIDNAGYDFWINMQWTSDGKELWNFISKYNPIILSAPSRQDDSKIGKFNWVKRELPGTQLILKSANRKKEHAKPNHILIDDREDNINDWIENHGEGILHTSTKNTIEILKNKYNIH
jgi:hypothetical protein